MSKVIMMCGVCGSGKTTYAKKKEQKGYIRLSIDEEMWKLYGRKGIDYPEEQYEKLSEQVEAALQKKLLSLIQQATDLRLGCRAKACGVLGAHRSTAAWRAYHAGGLL